MTPDETQMLIETRNDVKWIREWTRHHDEKHTSYLYLSVSTLIGFVITLFIALVK